MTASGPFAMGPSLMGAGGRRSAPRSNFAPTPFGGPSDKLGSGLTQSSAPSLKREKETNDLKGGAQDDDDDAGVYSEPDEGVQIVDMDDVRKMDWMAPETLLRDMTEEKKRKKKSAKIKKDDAATGLSIKLKI
jgi:DNA-directed RNA polymerase III subunit RPC4